MALPTYNKAKRRQTYEQLPKGAYVIKILGAKEEHNSNGGYIAIAFDIAEGPHKGFYQAQFDRNTNEDKKWPYDGVFNLTIPEDGSPEYVWRNWNTFFADLEDSNAGFTFTGDIKALKGKLIGGKFHIKQSQGDNGKVFNNTKMKWTCVAEDVRKGKAGQLPDDKLIATAPAATGSSADSIDGFMSIPDGADEELPF